MNIQIKLVKRELQFVDLFFRLDSIYMGPAAALYTTFILKVSGNSWKNKHFSFLLKIDFVNDLSIDSWNYDIFHNSQIVV